MINPRISYRYTTQRRDTTGSRLLLKISKTSCEFFNRKIYNLLDEVKQMEQEYRLSDPKSLVSDSKYHRLGPLALIGTAQAEYGHLRAEKE